MKNDDPKTLNFNETDCPVFLARELARASKSKDSVDESPLRMSRNMIKKNIRRRKERILEDMALDKEELAHFEL